MAVATIRPDGPVQTPAGWTVVGGANAAVVLADESDASYIDSPINASTSTSGVLVNMANTTIPAGAKVKGVRLSIRSKDDQTQAPFSCTLAARPFINPSAGTGVQSTPGNTAITTYDGGYEPAKPGGGPWTQADVNAFHVLLTATDNFFSRGQGGKIYRLAADVEYNFVPTVAPTATVVSGEAFASVGWVYADTEGDPQDAFRWAVFTAAQYGIGGFDPATSPSTASADWSLSTSARSLVTPNLANGTYRIYMQVRQASLSGQDMWSDWAFSAFSVSITPPAAPTLSAAVGQPYQAGRIALAYVINNSNPGSLLTVQYSDDAGATWTTHPLGDAVPVTAPSSGTFYDYEAPHGIARSYRIQVQTASLVTAWSATRTGSDPTRTWSLKDLTDPTRNVGDLKISDFRARPRHPRARYDPVGSPVSIIITDSPRGITGSFEIRSEDEDEYDDLQLLLRSGRTLLLQDVFGRQWHIFPGDEAEWSLLRATDPTHAYPIRHLHTASYTFDEVARPAVV